MENVGEITKEDLEQAVGAREDLKRTRTRRPTLDEQKEALAQAAKGLGAPRKKEKLKGQALRDQQEKERKLRMENRRKNKKLGQRIRNDSIYTRGVSLADQKDRKKALAKYSASKKGSKSFMVRKPLLDDGCVDDASVSIEVGGSESCTPEEMAAEAKNRVHEGTTEA